MTVLFLSVFLSKAGRVLDSESEFVKRISEATYENSVEGAESTTDNSREEIEKLIK